MARQPKLVLRKAERGIDLHATDRADTSQLHHLSDFLAWGTITIGHIDRAGQVAIAAEGKHVYVMASPVSQRRPPPDPDSARSGPRESI